MRGIGALTALLLVLSACAANESDDGAIVDRTLPSTRAEPTTTDAVSTTTAPLSLTFAAEGELNTEPFELPAGAFSVSFDLGGSCYYSASLASVAERGPSDVLANGSGPVTGENNVYRVEQGAYFVRMITGPVPDCPWSLTMTRRTDVP